MTRTLRLLFPLLIAVAVAAPAHTQAPVQPAAPPASTSLLLDINTATPAQLKTLPGVGDAYARRIIEGRPYLAKNQLVTRGVLPQSAYDKIKGQIIAHHVQKP